MARSRALAWLAMVGLFGSTAAFAQPAGPPPDPLPGPNKPESNIRRPNGVPPTAGAQPWAIPPQPALPPQPTPLGPAELAELRSRMVNGTRSLILDPKEVTAIRRSVLDAQGAGTYPGRDGHMPHPEPRLLSVTERSSLSAPETLNLAYGVVSPITFVDAKGRPWPIASVAFDPRLFAQDGTGCGTDVQSGSSRVAAAAGSDRPTSINLMPCRVDTWGNILIRLEGVAYPVALMVISGVSDHVDIPITVRVAGSSPLQPVSSAPTNTPPRASSAASVPASASETQLLHLFAAGTPPRDAQTLRASGGAQAWLYRDRMYVRARGDLLSPPSLATAEGGEGYKVWQLARPASRLLAEGADGSDIAITVDF